MILLFETDYRNIERYYLIHDYIKKEFYNGKTTIVFESKSQIEPFNSRFKGAKCLPLSKLKIASYRHLIINGNRIPDIYISILAKQKNIPVSYIQHGPHSIHMIRNKKFFVDNLAKSLRYLKYCINIFFITKKTSLLKMLILKNIYGGIRINQSLELYTPNFTYVFSEFYKKWHIKNYFGEKTKYGFLKNRDNVYKPKVEKNALVFCYQTLVEDGRIDPKLFFANLAKIKEYANKCRLRAIIKTHPRMSVAHLEKISNDGWEIFDSTTELPIGEITIGYYSSLLSLWAFYKSPVISIKLENHFIPNEVSNYCTLVEINDLMEMEFSFNEQKLQDRSKRVDYLFNFSGKEEFCLNKSH